MVFNDASFYDYFTMWRWVGYEAARLTQLAQCDTHALAKLDVESDRPDSIRICVHELPPM